MKIKFALLTLITFFFLSCSKKNEIELERMKYDVSFNINGFSQEIKPLAFSKQMSVGNAMSSTITGTELATHVTKLDYYVYDSNGALVNSVSQVAGTSNFGKFNDKLPTGKYEIVVVGNNFEPNTYIQAYTTITDAWIGLRSDYMLNELFITKHSITIASEPLNESIELKRVVGKLTLKILDAIPANISKITISTGSYDRYYLNPNMARTLSTTMASHTISTTDVEKINKTYDLFALLNETPNIADVYISVYNKAGALSFTKKIENIIMEKDKNTILSGKLFTASTDATGQVMTITLESTYKTTTVVNF